MTELVISMSPKTFKSLGEMPPGIQIVAGVFLAALTQGQGGINSIEPDDEIPDDAPEKVKNMLARKRGKSFRAAVGVTPENCALLQWLALEDRNMIILWNVEYPVRAEPLEG